MSYTGSLRFTTSFILRLKYLLDPCKINEPLEDVEIEVSDGILVSLKKGIKGGLDIIAIPPLTDAHTHMELSPLKGAVRREKLFGWIIDLARKSFFLGDDEIVEGVRDSIYSRFWEGVLYIGEISSRRLDLGVSVDIPVNIRFFLEFIRSFEGVLEKDNIGLSPHAIYSSREDIIKEVAFCSRERKLPFTIHYLESYEEERLFKEGSRELDWFYSFFHIERDFSRYSSSIEMLERLGVFDSYNPSFVHLTYGNRDVFEKIKESNGYGILCPSSNLFIEGKLPPVREMLDILGSSRIGIGTDSPASGLFQSVWDEMRILYLNLNLDPADILKMAVVGGRLAIGYDFPCISEGKGIELVLVKLPGSVGKKDILNYLMTVKEKDIVGIVTRKGLIWKKSSS